MFFDKFLLSENISSDLPEDIYLLLNDRGQNETIYKMLLEKFKAIEFQEKK